MPRRRGYRGRRRRVVGRGFGSFLKKSAKFLKDSGAISKIANIAGEMGVPHMDKVLKVSSALGMGRRRYRRRGGALRLAGGTKYVNRGMYW